MGEKKRTIHARRRMVGKTIKTGVNNATGARAHTMYTARKRTHARTHVVTTTTTRTNPNRRPTTERGNGTRTTKRRQSSRSPRAVPTDADVVARVRTCSSSAAGAVASRSTFCLNVHSSAVRFAGVFGPSRSLALHREIESNTTRTFLMDQKNSCTRRRHAVAAPQIIKFLKSIIITPVYHDV